MFLTVSTRICPAALLTAVPPLLTTVTVEALSLLLISAASPATRKFAPNCLQKCESTSSWKPLRPIASAAAMAPRSTDAPEGKMMRLNAAMTRSWPGRTSLL